MLSREEWLPLARKLDWDYTYGERRSLPTGDQRTPLASHTEWKDWEESF